MNLYLMRHSFAAWPAEAGSDDQRPLTPSGLQRAQAVGAALARRHIFPDLILHSPLVRARDTAAYVAQALARPETLRANATLQPGFELKHLRVILREHAQRESLMLVGHMPDMMYVLQTLTGRLAHFDEATVGCIHLDQPAEAVRGELLWLLSAEALLNSS